MNFYQPEQIVIDVQKHRVEGRSPDIDRSTWNKLLEEKSCKYYAIELGFRQINGVGQEEMDILEDCRFSDTQLSLLCEMPGYQ